MQITGLEVFTISVNERGNWLLVQLNTDEGPTGLGEASHGGGDSARDVIVSTILEQQCVPRLRGRDPRGVVSAVDALQPLVDGLAAATAVSACEQALWDLAGQAAGLPVYRLLGGPVRERIPLYANVNRATKERTPEGFAKSASAAVAEGFKAVKCAPFDGIEPLRVRDRDQRERIHHGLACVAEVRESVGSDVDVFVDCHGRFDVPTAVEVARELRSLGVTWFEEPVPTESFEELVQLRPLISDMELIGGEKLFGIRGFWPYFAAGIWDVIMPDVKHCGGIAAAMAVGQVATARGVKFAPHNPSGPVAMGASGHVAAAAPSLRSLEYGWGEVPWRADIITPREHIVDGELVVPTGPGLGITLNEPTLLAHQP
jgi:galactonate dehydratase